MRRFVMLLTFGHHGIDFRFTQDVRPVVPDHRTVTNITENPYDPILGRKRLFEPSAVQTDDFSIHVVAVFDVKYTVCVIDLTKSGRPGVRVDVSPTIVMTDVFPFIQRPIDDAQVLAQSAKNVDVNVRTVWHGICPIDDEVVVRGEDERLQPFLCVNQVPTTCSLQRIVVLDRLQHSFLYSFLAGKHPMSHERHPILHGSNISASIGIHLRSSRRNDALVLKMTIDANFVHTRHDGLFVRILIGVSPSRFVDPLARTFNLSYFGRAC